MIPRLDLFHQMVYDDGDFVAIANYTETPTDYKVYEKQSGEYVGGTNCHYWEPQVRLVIKSRIQWLKNTLHLT